MDNTDLQQLARHLENHGLQVTTDAPGMRLTVTNPLNSRLTETIAAADDRWATSFDYEIGEHGNEAACAERIARILAVEARG
ncbi:hypothetical protein ACFY0A_36165 [Streptomyces sp. NPDC001698]|uniref:hypothetical protein n=1 Tax=Streptomyces sp. NPDC001698 TaxID=3364601 RepID=UPI0036B5FF5F